MQHNLVQRTDLLEALARCVGESPKLYFRDSGLLHFFLGMESMDMLLAHPRLGASPYGLADKVEARPLQKWTASLLEP